MQLLPNILSMSAYLSFADKQLIYHAVTPTTSVSSGFPADSSVQQNYWIMSYEADIPCPAICLTNHVLVSLADSSTQQGPLERCYVADILGHYPETRTETAFDPDATRMVSTPCEHWTGIGERLST